MMQLFWTPEALQDRIGIFEYIIDDNPSAAIELDELFAQRAGN